MLFCARRRLPPSCSRPYRSIPMVAPDRRSASAPKILFGAPRCWTDQVLEKIWRVLDLRPATHLLATGSQSLASVRRLRLAAKQTDASVGAPDKSLLNVGYEYQRRALFSVATPARRERLKLSLLPRILLRFPRSIMAAAAILGPKVGNTVQEPRHGCPQPLKMRRNRAI